MSEGQDDGAWFEPKTYGLGAGLPIAWQGWVLLAGYLGIVALSAFVIEVFGEEGVIIGVPVMIVSTLLFVFIIGSKTRGGMRWRWGKKDK